MAGLAVASVGRRHGLPGISMVAKLLFTSRRIWEYLKCSTFKTKNEILDYNLQTGVMKLKSHYNEKTLILRVYIPPRYFGYEVVSAFYNDNNVDVTHTYKVNRGISKQASRSLNFSTGLIFEIASAIDVGIDPSISLTYIWEDTIINEQTESESFTTTVSPGESIEIWQKVATYSRQYVWHSGFPTVTC